MIRIVNENYFVEVKAQNRAVLLLHYFWCSPYNPSSVFCFMGKSLLNKLIRAKIIQMRIGFELA